MVIPLSEQLARLEKASTPFARQAGPLSALSLATFQINLGKRCNQACRHCHVDASPARTEAMDDATLETCLRIIHDTPSIATVDITGGAPEMHPRFARLVEEVHAMGRRIIDRCNLTILEHEGYTYLYDFLPAHEAEIVASLPHFSAARTDGQRGNGVFDASIRALRGLNARGYGTRLPLHLVYNPTGLFLSSDQKALEREFKEALEREHGVRFNNLYCINNMPINRFLDALVRKGKFETYMEVLTGAYNPATLEGLMCRHQISVGWDGAVYDCDFNQMLGLEAEPIAHVRDFDAAAFLARRIVVRNHCYGCTAGSGSSCGGELT